GKGKAGERCPQRDEGVLGKRQPVLADGLKYLRRRREHEGVDLENAADELPEHEHADSEQPGRQSFQRGTHGLRTPAALARTSCRMSVKCGLKQISRSRGRGRSTVLVMTMCPGRALMTWMLSARNAASRRSCVTRITVKPSFCHKSRSTHHNSSRVKASSAANGSSSINSAGRWISARQSETRCGVPPDSSPGNRLPKPSSPTGLRTASARVRDSYL